MGYGTQLKRKKRMETYGYVNGINSILVDPEEPDALNHPISVKKELYSTFFKTKKNVQIHDDADKYVCAVCAKCYMNKDTMMRHMKTHTEQRNHKCDVCTKMFKTKESLSVHMKIHIDGRNHKCEICSKRFKTRQNMKQHVRTHSVEKYYKCEACVESFATRQYALEHMNVHINTANITCEICAALFETKVGLTLHMDVHVKEENYRCDVCFKDFKRRRNMLAHVETHAIERKYKCGLCGGCFKTRPSLVHHMRSRHARDNHECHVCSKSFDARVNMLEHMKTHAGDNSDECAICSEVSKRWCMSRYLGTHMNERNLYECDVCNKSFKTKRWLSRHLKTHTSTRRNVLGRVKVHEENRGCTLSCDVDDEAGNEGNIKEEFDWIVKKESFEIGVMHDEICDNSSILMDVKPESAEVSKLNQTPAKTMLREKEGVHAKATDPEVHKFEALEIKQEMF